ncbi:MAG TPA: hypothetical protein VI819_03505 [Patescibacteria group bacterium]|nr:hypothetical protein [Patescibacteria group bacterium]
METHSEEKTVRRINRNRGESAFLQDGKTQEGHSRENGRLYAKADTFVIGRDGPVLEAWGGACRVIAMYENAGKNGAVIHINAVDLWGNRHEELIDQLLEAVPDLSKSALPYVLGDTSSLDPYVQELEGDRESWNKAIAEYLKKKGIKNVKVFSSGEGKDVSLDTQTGILKVLDDNGKPLLEVKMS